MCRHHIRPDSLLELPAEEAKYSEPEDSGLPIKSAKIDELVKYLKIFDPSDKTLVFSQFTSFLDHVGANLTAAGISHCRFDGTMTAKKVSERGLRVIAVLALSESGLTNQRHEVISSFQTPSTANKSTPKVMLISLKSGAVGLNLTAASNVFLVSSHRCLSTLLNWIGG
jgi:SWI/SNF-related matrix-associated actin-dependent regulator of chromatin subfamily A3